MKKNIFIIIVCIMFVPFFVSAKDKCTIVSGTGNDIGDEIKCGTESFNIVSVKDDKVQMLAKYNLMVGDKIDFIKIDINDYDSSSMDEWEFCFSEAEEAGYKPYDVYPTVDADGNPGCRIYEEIQYDKVVQDEKAVGTVLKNGRSVLPLYGIVYMSPGWGREAVEEGTEFTYDYDSKGNLKLNTTYFEQYLDGYKNELKRQEIDVQDVEFIYLSRTIELLETISGKEVEIELEYPDGNISWYDPEEIEFWYGHMDIKEYTGDHKWIYNTTYWLGSGFESSPDIDPNTDYHNDYYISNEGMICAIGRQGDCTYFEYPIGNGIRPLVTIPKNEIAKPIVNPETGQTVAIITFILIIGAATGYYFIKRKNNA